MMNERGDKDVNVKNVKRNWKDIEMKKSNFQQRPLVVGGVWRGLQRVCGTSNSLDDQIDLQIIVIAVGIDFGAIFSASSTSGSFVASIELGTFLVFEQVTWSIAADLGHEIRHLSTFSRGLRRSFAHESLDTGRFGTQNAFDHSCQDGSGAIALVD